MADFVSYAHRERDTDQALIALKKGSQLLKYRRKGKPRFRAFRLSSDETTLIWLSHGEERNLKLSSVSRIIPGQRTAVFKRFSHPEKDYLSFSLIYKNGERSLDLVCKDKAEAEIWFGGLKSLIGYRNRRGRSEIPEIHDVDYISNGRPSTSSLDFAYSISPAGASVDYSHRTSNFRSSDVRSERGNMQLRTSTDGFRISVSSTPSCSSGGSGPDDIESLGDVYVWGEVWSDGIQPDGSLSSVPVKTDVLIPKPLESNVVLDVHQIACGVRHVALVTRQGEVFTWGEESGGRLGHGVEQDVCRPHLVEFLALTNIDFVACGEYHTCAVSTSGDLFTWGDGIHNAGLLGHGTDISHWIPKRVSGPLDGLQVLSVACGTWHSALATTTGKLFTFGDGSFGALGHGDRESVSYPKQVHSLSGLKTVKVACGLWHTAAIVEVMGHSGSSVSSRKLFTWGDGDKHRLGHGSKETYLVPTCVSALIDYNFQQLGCGHTMTVALTTSGHVFTMGSTAHGQLGNTVSDGKLPCLVQDKLVGEFVEEIACGAYHIAVLTSRSEVYSWGKGANGRLGHGDVEDRKTPTLIESLKDRHVKNIACGSNFTSSICIHKWVSGADQSVCSGCRQAFGFTRKRHNCYNCGLVHCHACSSKKALKAALAPTPGKPHRVCDACYAKLKAAEAGYATNVNWKAVPPRRSVDGTLKPDRESRTSRILLSPTTEPVKYLEVRSQKPGVRSDSPDIVRASQIPSRLPLKDIAFPSSLSALQNAFRPSLVVVSAGVPPPPPPLLTSRPTSPYARRPSPPRTSGFSKNVIDGLKKKNDVLNQESTKLQNQIRHLKKICDSQEAEIQKLQKATTEATTLAADQSSKHNAATEFVKTIKEQLQDLVEKLPPEVSESEVLKTINNQAEAYLNTNEASETSILQESIESVEQIAAVLKSSNTIDQGIVEQAMSTESSAVAENASQQSQSRSLEGSTTTGGKETMEQFERGVYVTYLQLPNGGKIFKRVRFSKRRFAEQQAEEWWSQNKDRLLKKYSPHASEPATVSAGTLSNPTIPDPPASPQLSDPHVSPLSSDPPASPSLPQSDPTPPDESNQEETSS